MVKKPYNAYVSFLSGEFEWDPEKDLANIAKHGVGFAEAQGVFSDPLRVFMTDDAHSTPAERQFFCFGKSSRGVLTVRFTLRGRAVRIFGAGYWAKGRRIYEQANQVHPRAED